LQQGEIPRIRPGQPTTRRDARSITVEVQLTL
jgi:hypothetical protein